MKKPCDDCPTRKMYARTFDMQISGEDCPYNYCEEYEHWKEFQAELNHEKKERMTTMDEKDLEIQRLKRELQVVRAEKKELAEKNRKLMRALEATTAEREAVKDQIDRITEELTLTRKKLVIVVESIEELAERYEVGKDVVQDICSKLR